MPDTAAIDIESSAFAVRLGKLLMATRRARGRSIRAMAAAANGVFSAAQLRQIERGSRQLDEPLIGAVCEVYGGDLGAILPSRLPVSIGDRVITAGGVRVGYSTDDPRSVLTAYLRLIRAMRHQKKAPAIALRRDDIVALARQLKLPGEDVVDRLTSLMGATAAQRTAIASLFATDAIVIGLAVAGAVTMDPESVVQATKVAAPATGSVEPDEDDVSPVPDVAEVEVVDPLVPDVAEVEIVDPPVPDVADVEIVDPLAPDVADVGIVDPLVPGVAEVAVVTVDLGTPARYDHPIEQAIPSLDSPGAVIADIAGRSAAVAETSSTDSPEADAVADTAWSTEVATGAESALTSPTLAPPNDTTPTGLGAITMAADSASLEPAVRMPQPEVPPEPPAPPQLVNESGCNTDVASPAMRVVIPDISYDCPVYAGGQALIDAGFVTLVTDAFSSSALTTRPGGPGTLWLAAHRTTHGGAFADVPGLADGAIVIVADGTDIASYRVVGRAYVEVRDGRVVDASGHTSAEATWESVVRPDGGGSNLAPRLLLQTCEGENFRWMIYADLVSG